MNYDEIYTQLCFKQKKPQRKTQIHQFRSRSEIKKHVDKIKKDSTLPPLQYSMYLDHLRRRQQSINIKSHSKSAIIKTPLKSETNLRSSYVDEKQIYSQLLEVLKEKDHLIDQDSLVLLDYHFQSIPEYNNQMEIDLLDQKQQHYNHLVAQSYKIQEGSPKFDQYQMKKLKTKSKSMDRSDCDTSYLKHTEKLYSRAFLWSQNYPLDLQIQTIPIESISLDLPVQRIIKFDVLRTRAQYFDHQLSSKLEYLLTYYSKDSKIVYKQGLNELAAPFIILLKAGISLQQVYTIYKGFIKQFMTNFYDDQYIGIQTIYRGYNILLNYHDPQLAQYLSQIQFLPEFYITPWFITMMISKSSLNIAQLIVENIMLINDQLFIFSFTIALIISNRQNIFNTDAAHVPQYITGITIKQEEQLYNLIKIAHKIHCYTPESFRNLIFQSDLFNQHSNPRLIDDNQYLQMNQQEFDHILFNHLIIKPFPDIFQLQALKPQLPIIICDDLDQKQQERLNGTLVNVIDVRIFGIQKMFGMIENFKLTNKIRIIVMIKNERIQKQILRELGNTKYVCKGCFLQI